jgi:hypothetical protein
VQSRGTDLPCGQRKSPARKNYFREPLQSDQRIVPVARKYFTFVFSEIVVGCRHPASTGGALRAIVTTREAGMRWTSGLAACTRVRTNKLVTDGEIVWSWPPGAEAKSVVSLMRHADDGGNNAGPRGERV